MQKFPRINRAAFAFGKRMQSAKAVLGTAALVAMSTAPGLALATPAGDLGDEAASQLSGASTIVKGLLITLIGIVFLFVVYKLITRAK